MTVAARIVRLGALAAGFMTLLPTGAQGDTMLRGTVGYASASGEVGDEYARLGADAGGEVYVAASKAVHLGGGLHMAFLGDGHEDVSVAMTLEAGAIAYLASPERPARPFLGCSLGRGRLAWVRSLLGNDDDAVGFWFLAPNGGISFRVSDYVSLASGARYLIAAYDTNTDKGYRFDLDGGNFLQLFASLELHL
jgi:hypothetical protein